MLTSPWAFHPHPEVYLEVLGLGAAYWAALRLLGPRFVEPGEPAATRGQKLSFAGGLLFVALAEGWPLADIANNYLYSAHMVQHLLFTLAAPPLLLLGTPHWLARTLVRRPGVWPVMKRLTRPVPETIIPTVPASFLTFASSPLYHFYTTVPRAFGISAVDDTRISGLIMKLGMGIVLWSIIAVLFFRWSSKEERPEQPDVLEWQAVERELNRTESNNP